MDRPISPALSQAIAAPGDYIPALDGLRAVAILLVVGSHLGLDRFLPGAFGVTLFFFVSGYLITRQLLVGLARRGRIGLAGFYLRRMLRLAPAGLAYTALAGLAYVAAGGRITVPGWLCAVFYSANIYDVWVGYRSTLARVRHPFNILWSLGIEEHFYAVWPLLLTLAWRARWLVAGLVALCLAALAWRFWLFGHCATGVHGVCGRPQPNPFWRYNRLYMGTDTRIDSIAWGAVLAVCEHRHAATVRRAAPLWPCGLAMLAVVFLLQSDLARQVLRTTLQGIGLLMVFPALLHGHGHGLVPRLLSTAPALLVGRLSYSLYLWHWGAFGVADWVAGPNRPLWLAVALPLSTAAALASYLLIEQPMLRLRRRAGSHAPAALLSRTAPALQETPHAAH